MKDSNGNGKGSKPRKKVDYNKYREGWDIAFKKKKSNIKLEDNK